MTNHETIREFSDQLEAEVPGDTPVHEALAEARRLCREAASLINDLCREAGVVMEEAVVTDPNSWYGD